MNTVISILGGFGGYYSLWKELTTTNNNVTVIYFDFTNNTNAESSLKKQGLLANMNRVIPLMKQNLRDFTFQTIPVNSWTAEPFHAIEFIRQVSQKVNNGDYDRVLGYYLKDEEHEYTIQMVKGMKHVFNELCTRGELVFDGIENEVSKLQALKELPSFMLPYINYCINIDDEGNSCGYCYRCKHHQLDLTDKQLNVSNSDFLTKKLNLIGKGPNPTEYTTIVSDNGNFLVENHPVYGSFGGPRTPLNYPFEQIPDKHIFV